MGPAAEFFLSVDNFRLHSRAYVWLMTMGFFLCGDGFFKGLKELGRLSSKSFIKFCETKQFSAYRYREFDLSGDVLLTPCFYFWKTMEVRCVLLLKY